MSLCKHVLGVRKTTSNIKVLAELGRLPFKIYIQTQVFKYFTFTLRFKYLTFFFKREHKAIKPSLRKAINEEIKITKSGWIVNLKYLLDSCGLSNLQSSRGRHKKDYKNKQFLSKRAKDCFIQENVFTYASEKMNIFTQTKVQYKKKTYLNL